jgi:nicotinamidase-related amidase
LGRHASGHRDVAVYEHQAQSGFANTELDVQLNKQYGIQRIDPVGLMACSCIESTDRHGMEMGCQVTLMRDATAAFSAAEMHAAHEVNVPMFAHAILTIDQFLPQLG